MNWSDYDLNDPLYGVGRNDDLDAESARIRHERLIESKEARLETLRGFFAHNQLPSGTSDTDVRRVRAWLVENAERLPVSPRRSYAPLTPEWDSLARDLAFWLGEITIARHPEYRWMLHTGDVAGHADYQSTVVAFAPDPHEGRAANPFTITRAAAWRAANSDPAPPASLATWMDSLGSLQVWMDFVGSGATAVTARDRVGSDG